MTTSNNYRPQKVAGVEINEVADGLVVFDPTTQRVHYLNSSASVVYELCDGRSTTEDIVAQATELFAGSSPADSLTECVGTLAELGLIH